MHRLYCTVCSVTVVMALALYRGAGASIHSPVEGQEASHLARLNRAKGREQLLSYPKKFFLRRLGHRFYFKGKMVARATAVVPLRDLLERSKSLSQAPGSKPWGPEVWAKSGGPKFCEDRPGENPAP